MTTKEDISPLLKLQENASAYFEKVEAKHNIHMQCKKGCSKCCHVELSIFEVEAARIKDWFDGLDENQKIRLKALWKTENPSEGFPSLTPCPFLYDNACTIYEARPTICRTQGAALSFKQIDEEDAEEHLLIDACDLNFTEENSFPEQSDWLDLDRLNTLLSIAENHYQKIKTDCGIGSLQKVEGRIHLAVLKDCLKL